ncbi:outer membrane protein assembly factor BamE [Allochromatium warmingii]|uniref:Outer membrane protein assembly factor BamE n=1 Tax=Allochromatium warmingii TaxID=61595 RepID=A0A1H3EYG8_ALLWA|nr:outer membrane protein assembly factor BamE [Allochromatium warmingii]SDX82954.1 outer membrane protein assembly factor BamE [Allochromatium warmingii]
MRQFLSLPIVGVLVVSALTGCTRETKPEAASNSLLETVPFVYKMTIQQGNILTEAMIDALELGMNKRQVNFLLGTPPLVSFFHADRWDYTYTIQRGHQPMEQRDLTLHFKDDLLVRIEGTQRPDPKRAAARASEQILLDVPDYEAREGLIRQGLKKIGLDPKN